jgi:hypothetical protein
MSRLLRITPVVLCWILLAGLNPAWAQTPTTVPAVAPIDAPSQTWKSCAARLYAAGDLPTAGLESQFERPQNLAQLLQNLKLAWKNDWLMRPQFFDRETLLKFFNGTAVSLQQRENVPPPYVSIVATTASSVFPQMSVELETTCSSRSSPQPNGRTQTLVTVSGHIRIYGGPVPELTLRSIRQVLGSETQNTLDDDFAEGGAERPPTHKGSVTYIDRAKEQLEGGKVGLFFYFNLPPRFPDALPPGIESNDTVQGIVLADMSHRTQEN